MSLSSNNEFLVARKEIYHLIEMNRIDAALGRIHNLLSTDPHHPELLFLEAACLYHKDNLEEAVLLCSEAIHHGYLLERCHFLMAKILVKKNDYMKAEEHYLEALRLNPHSPDVLANYGELMFKTGHEKKAFKLVDEALRLDPYDSAALDFYIKYHLAANNQFAHADVLQRYMVSSDSELAKLIRIGLSQIMFKKYKEARETFKQAYLMDPTNIELLEILQDIEVNSHFYFKPLQWGERIGGPKVIWVGFIIFALALRFLKLYSVLLPAVSIYLIYAVYTWTTIPVRKYLEKKMLKD